MKSLGAAVLAALVLALETSGGGARGAAACWHRGTPSATARAAAETRR